MNPTFENQIRVGIFFNTIWPILVRYKVPIDKIDEHLSSLINYNDLILLNDDEVVVYDKNEMFQQLSPESLLFIEDIHIGNYPNGLYIFTDAHFELIIFKIKGTNNPMCGCHSKGFPTPINNQITDSITESNIKIIADSPAVAMGIMYREIESSINI